ncbi:unnamed protein product, partial [Discosporangium mesarthrocarpum]
LVLSKEDFRVAARGRVWKSIQPALYGFFRSILHILGQLQDHDLLCFVLSSLEGYIPFLVPFPGLARAYLKALLALWGEHSASSSSSSSGRGRKGGGGGDAAGGVRLLAYLRIRQMATALPFPFVEGCMKGLYLAFAKRAHAPPKTAEGRQSLGLMEGCVVELYRLDTGSAYQNAFLYIRQLSLLIRKAVMNKSKDSVTSLRKWQVITCLRLWTGILASAPRDEELRVLIFPLAQVLSGVMRFASTLRYAPLCFQLCRMRQRLAAAASLYVPCLSPLLAVLRSPALFKK